MVDEDGVLNLYNVRHGLCKLGTTNLRKKVQRIERKLFEDLHSALQERLSYYKTDDVKAIESIEESKTKPTA